MKNELGITKWIVGRGNGVTGPTTVTSNTITVSEQWPYQVISFGMQTVCAVVAPESEDNFLIPDLEKMRTNAQLIAEAGTVANETGKTPRQLADDNKVLLEALGSILEYWNRDRNDEAMHNALWHIINVSESAIKQVTE